MKILLNILFQVTFVFAMHSQNCFEPDESIWLNPWQSCTKSNNPKTDYGQTHWIKYNFGEIRTLSTSWIWNCNDPSNLDKGFKDVYIDYSIDGVQWSYWGNFSFPKAEGQSIYSGFPGPNFDGIQAQFVLISVISTHGEGDCASISEIKFNLLPGYEESISTSIYDAEDLNKVYTVFPNPVKEKLFISGDLSKNIKYIITDVYGHVVRSGFLMNSNFIEIENLTSGTYFLHLEYEVHKILKI